MCIRLIIKRLWIYLGCCTSLFLISQSQSCSQLESVISDQIKVTLSRTTASDKTTYKKLRWNRCVWRLEVTVQMTLSAECYAATEIHLEFNSSLQITCVVTYTVPTVTAKVNGKCRISTPCCIKLSECFTRKFPFHQHAVSRNMQVGDVTGEIGFYNDTNSTACFCRIK